MNFGRSSSRGNSKIIAEFTKLPSDTVRIQFHPTRDNEESILIVNELRDIVSAIRLTSCMLLPLVMNEDEDNFLAINSSGRSLELSHYFYLYLYEIFLEVMPLLSEMIKTYNQNDQRFYGFSFIELLNGLSKLMVRGRTHEFIDQNLVNHLLHILEKPNNDTALIECVSNAILNASFDAKVQALLDSDRTVHIIQSTRNNYSSSLVQKNCEAILWTLNRIPHRSSSSLSEVYQLQGHIMISYNRSVTAMCLKIRDGLKVLFFFFLFVPFRR